MKTRLYFFILIYSISNFSVLGQWKLLSLGTNASFRSLSVVDTATIWAGGSNGTVVRSVNGGKTWDIYTINDVKNLDFRGIHAFNANLAWAMSAGDADKGLARIYKTTDGGKNWQLVFHTTQQGVFLDCLKMKDKKVGFVVGDGIGGKPYFLKTTDGGNTWKQISVKQLPNILEGEASYAASNSSIAIQGKKVWICTQNRVFISKNNGKSWKVVVTPFEKTQSGGIFGLYFWNTHEGIATGGDYRNDKKMYLNIAITKNGGETWQTTNFAEPYGLKESAWLRSNSQLIAVGTSGTSLSTDKGKTWQAIDNQAFHVIQCQQKKCYAIGAKGQLGVWNE